MTLKRSRAAYEADLQRLQSPYVFFGTPLAPLDDNARDDGSYVPVWKQEVVDERGRKRLHGAFTGGFSAGYFNSVGSKEGWTPATFVSSRSKRAAKDAVRQSADDYMDDEDRADADEAAQLQTKDAYSGLGSTGDELAQKGRFMDLFRPQDETMGLKLLRRMGWRDGQGIGPQVRRRRRKMVLYDPGGVEGGEEEEYLAAPENTKLITFVRKSDTKGLGYGDTPGLVGRRSSAAQVIRDEESHRTPSSTKPKPTKPKRGGMGIGVLNDTGSDDEDPYEIGPRLSLPRAANGDKKKKKKQADDSRAASNANPLLKNKPLFSKKASGFRKCHDGKLPLDGFVLSTQGSVNEDKKYPVPTVPDGWVSAKQKSSTSKGPSGYQSSADLARASAHDPSSRASLLGEAPLPGKSIFDFLTPAARDKLVVASNNPNLPAAGSEAASASTQTKGSEPQFPYLDPSVAASALARGTTGFVPYTDDPPKLARYRAFLAYSASLDRDSTANGATKPPECPPGMRRTDFANELAEFAHAATIFKPMTGAMASRFTSSKSAGGISQQNPGSSANDDDSAVAIRPPLPPEEEAARAGMWGAMTRRSERFYPARLLCKRFGVAPPQHTMPGADDGAGNKVTPDMLAGLGSRFASGGVQDAEMDEADRRRRDKLEILGKKDMDELRRASGLPELGTAVRRKNRAQEDPTAVDPNVNEALEAERPSEETFKAIFGGDE